MPADVMANEGTQIVSETPMRRSMQLRGNFRRSAQGRDIVVVLGMHRSGTSLLANVLHLLGVDMVDHPTRASIKNETGFWEREDIVALQDEILASLGAPVGSPAHAAPFAPGWWRSVEIRPLKDRLRDLVEGHLKGVRRPWGFKDPRTCRLLPLWGEILEELDVTPRFVWAVRHPAESARSMTAKNPHRAIQPTQSEVMWLAYNYDILRYAGRSWPLVVPYEGWFGDSLSLAKDLAHELDLVWQGSDHELESALGSLINPELRHHWAGEAKVRCALGLSEEVYRSILTLRSGLDGDVSEPLVVSLQSLLGAVQPFALEARDGRVAADDVKRLNGEVAQHKASAEQSSASLAQLEARIEKQRENEAILTARSETLARKLAEARQEREAQASAKAELEQRIETLVREAEAAAATSAEALAAARARQAALEEAHAGLAAAHRTEVETVQKLREDLAQAEGRHQELTGVHAALDQTHAALGEQHAGAVQELADLQASHSALEGDLDVARNDSARLKSENESLQQRLDGFRSKHTTAIAEKEKLAQDLIDLGAARDAIAAERDALAAAKARMESELETQGQKLETFRTQLRDTTAVLRRAEQEMSILRDSNAAEIAALKAEAQRGADIAEAESVMLQRESERLSMELFAASEARDALRVELAQVNDLHEETASRFGLMEQSFASLTQSASGLEAEQQALRQALEQAQGEAATHLAGLSERDQRIEALDAEITELRAAQERLANEAGELRSRLSARDDEARMLAKTLAEADAKGDRLAAAHDAIRQQHEDLASTHERVTAEALKLRGDVAAIRNTMRDERERFAEALAEARAQRS